MPETIKAQLRESGGWVLRDLLMRIGFGIGFVAFDYFVLNSMFFSSEPKVVEFSGSILMLLMWNAVPTSATMNQVDSRVEASICMDFTRPISTFQLAMVPAFLNLLAGITCFLATSSLYLWCLGTSFPLLSPAMLMICVMCCCFAVAWSTTTVLGRVSIWLSTHAAMFSLCMLGLSWLGEPQFWDFSGSVYVGMFLVSTLALAATVLVVNRRRCGMSIWDDLGLTLPLKAVRRWRRSRQGDERLPGKILTDTFSSAWVAQCFYEFQKLRRILLLPVCVVPLLVLIFVGLANYYDPDEEACLGLFSLLLLICPIGYQIVGAAVVALRNSQGVLSFPIFDATRPMPCDQMVGIKLLSITAWSLIGWLLMVIACLAYSPFIADDMSMTKVIHSLTAAEQTISAYWWITGAVLAMPILVSMTPLTLTAQYVSTNPRRPFRSLAVILVGLSHILMIAAEFRGFWSFGGLWMAYSYIAPFLAVAWCVSTVRASLASGFVGKPYLFVSLTVWAVFAVTMIALLVQLSPSIPPTISSAIPESSYFLVLAILLTPLAATLSAPNELASYRHG